MIKRPEAIKLIKNPDQMQHDILKVLETQGPCCFDWIVSECCKVEFLTKEYMALLPEMLLLIYWLIEEGKILKDVDDDPECPLRLPNQHLGVAV